MAKNIVKKQEFKKISFVDKIASFYFLLLCLFTTIAIVQKTFGFPIDSLQNIIKAITN